MKVLERHIEGAVLRWSRKHGIFDIKLNLMAHRSLPDRLFFIPGGRPTLIEFKRPGEVPTPLQQQTIERLRKLGYEVYIVDNKEDGIAILTKAVTIGIAVSACIKTLDTAQLSKARSAVAAATRKRGAVSRSWSGEN